MDSDATLVAGGKRAGNKGFYIQPTIYSDVKVQFNRPFTIFFFKFYIRLLPPFIASFTKSRSESKSVSSPWNQNQNIRLKSGESDQKLRFFY
jgi:hypothetical protein